MSRIAVIYWTATTNTQKMAGYVAEGCRVNGDEVAIFSTADITVDEAVAYDKVALGCPAMGDEVLEEYEFQPFYDEFKTKFGKKPLVLFGSYSWNDGLWMANWENDARNMADLNVVDDGLICYSAPDTEEKIAKCKALGESLAKS